MKWKDVIKKKKIDEQDKKNNNKWKEIRLGVLLFPEFVVVTRYEEIGKTEETLNKKKHEKDEKKEVFVKTEKMEMKWES